MPADRQPACLFQSSRSCTGGAAANFCGSIHGFFFGAHARKPIEIIGSEEPEPEAIVFTLFHEAPPLYEHKKEKYIFHILETAHRHRPDLSQWIRENFNPFLQQHDQVAEQAERESYWKIQYLETVQKSIEALQKPKKGLGGKLKRR